jgi:UDP-N-acetylglucosamine--dolichyl-phosphate N-acetylglucosaminephosphotransferase
VDKFVALLIGAIGLPVCAAITRFLISWNASHGIFGVDVHKIEKPSVPEMCGAAMAITLIALAGVYLLFDPRYSLQLISFMIVVGIAAVAGAVDDFKRLGGMFKPLAGLLCGIPVSILGLLFPGQVYNAALRVPLFGGFRLPVIYPLIIPLAISVTANTVNMLDPLNGVMAGGIAIACTGLLIGLLLTSQAPTPIFLYALVLFASLGFFIYNRYPSRAFSGNVGQLSLGAALGAAAILGRAEIATIVAIFPNIQNSFFFLSKIRRFTEHRRLTSKPTVLLPDGRLSSTPDRGAPLTLVRTIISGGPAFESDIVKTILLLYLLSSMLGLLTLLLMGPFQL